MIPRQHKAAGYEQCQKEAEHAPEQDGYTVLAVCMHIGFPLKLDIDIPGNFIIHKFCMFAIAN